MKWRSVLCTALFLCGTVLLSACGGGEMPAPAEPPASSEVPAPSQPEEVPAPSESASSSEPEPLPEDSPLWDAPRMYITPHISGQYHLQETFERIVRIAGGNLEKFLAGEKDSMKNLVDFKTGYRRR